ncbi:MAG: hypothetical protein ACI90V_004924, partial [Bacillariaceae sp.]
FSFIFFSLPHTIDTKARSSLFLPNNIASKIQI